MKDRVQFREHGLTVLVSDYQTGGHEDYPGQREQEHLLLETTLLTDNIVQGDSADPGHEAGDLDGPVLQGDSGDGLSHAEKKHNQRGHADTGGDCGDWIRITLGEYDGE